MRPFLLPFFIAAAGTTTGTTHFRFERPVLNTAASPAQTCLAVEAELFAHAAPGLADLRLFHGSAEIPYALRTVAPALATQISVAPLNLGVRDGHTAFSAAMPTGRYSDITLEVSAQNFIAAVTVTGKQAPDASKETRLGQFTIFDLTAQKLGRSTVLHLPPSDFRYLQFTIVGPVKPRDISEVSVAREPLAQVAFAPVASRSQASQAGHTSVIGFTVPAHVPVDRIVFVPTPQPTAFTRDVAVTVTSRPPLAATDENESPQPATFSGNILRLHRTEAGQKIDEERLAIDTVGQAFARETHWSISVDNGDDPPLAFESVRLEMQQRDLCFQADANRAYSLFYGDSTLASPHYDYATLFTPEKNAVRAVAAPEQPNPEFQPREDQRPFTERHPALLWLTLLATIITLVTVALRSANETNKPT